MVKRRQAYLALLTLIVAAPASAGPIDVYIIAGQSNAVGGAWPPYPPGELLEPRASLYNYYLETGVGLENSPTWEQVRTLWPSFPANVSFGVEITFAAEMERRTGRPIAIIKVAQNGANLHTQWKPSAGDIYPIALSKIQASLASLSDFGLQPQLSGVLWIQGETDAVWSYWADLYATNLAELTASLRTDLVAPNLPVALNMLHANSAPAYREILRDRQVEFAESDRNTFIFDPSDLPLNDDGFHYSNSSFLELGRRFADLYAPTAAAADFDRNGQVDGGDLVHWRNGVGDANEDGAADGADFLIWQRLLEDQTPLSAAADFDRNGQVDSGDLVHWRNGVGDANQDGTADGADFLIWQQQLSATSTFVMVPEPATAGCALILGMLLWVMTPARSLR